MRAGSVVDGALETAVAALVAEMAAAALDEWRGHEDKRRRRWWRQGGGSALLNEDEATVQIQGACALI